MVPTGCYLMVHLVSFVYVISGPLKNIQLIFHVILVPCTDSVACQSFSHATLENETMQRIVKTSPPKKTPKASKQTNKNNKKTPQKQTKNPSKKPPTLSRLKPMHFHRRLTCEPYI